MTTNPEVLGQTRATLSDRVSYEAFLESSDEDTRAEWAHGAVEIMSPSSGRHQEILHFLIQVLGLWIRSKQLGVIRSETFLMRLAEPIRSARLPDLLFIARDHLDRLKPTVLEGPADLAVEIISAESVGRDRGDKFVEYEQAGIPEYWLIDPERQQAEFYELGTDGRYRLVLGGRSGEYRSRVLEGFTLDLDWLWQEPTPNPLDLLRQLDVLRD